MKYSFNTLPLLLIINIMKKGIVLFVLLVFMTPVYSQSIESILMKAGGQLIQDLSNHRGGQSIGKAIETAGDMKYEMERIKAQNNYEIVFKTNPENVTKVYPLDGYKWKSETVPYDYTVEKVVNKGISNCELAIDLLVNGDECIQQFDFDNGLIYTSQSIQLCPTAAAFANRGWINVKLGNFNKALEDLGTALNYDISDLTFSWLYLIKGYTFSLMQDYSQAIPVFEKGLKLFEQASYDLSSISDCYSYLAIMKVDIQDYQGCVADLTKALELSPDNYFAYLSRAYARASLKDTEGYISDLDLTLEHLPSNEFVTKMAVLSMKAVAYYTLEDFRVTISLANEAINIYESNYNTPLY